MPLNLYKSISIVFTLSVLLCCSVGSLADTAALQAPGIRLVDVDLASMDFSSIQLIVALEVDNINDRDIEVESLAYHLKINEEGPISNHITQATMFPALTKRDVRIPVSLVYDEHLPTLLAALASSAPSSYEIYGIISLKGKNQGIPFRHKGSVVFSDL